MPKRDSEILSGRLFQRVARITETMTDESNKATTPTVGRGLDEAILESVKRHISGAIVVHSNPFEELPIPVPREQLSREFTDRWVVPLYMTLRNAESEPFSNPSGLR
jgi:hypothetical protein